MLVTDMNERERVRIPIDMEVVASHLLKSADAVRDGHDEVVSAHMGMALLGFSGLMQELIPIFTKAVVVDMDDLDKPIPTTEGEDS